MTWGHEERGAKRLRNVLQLQASEQAFVARRWHGGFMGPDGGDTSQIQELKNWRSSTSEVFANGVATANISGVRMQFQNFAGHSAPRLAKNVAADRSPPFQGISLLG